MHLSFRQSVAYMVPKQEQCVSDIIEVAPANHFQISSDMVSSDMVASWCLNDIVHDMDLPSYAS